MDPPSILYILIGSLVIAGRGPMVFAPRATLRFFDRLLSTDARVRGISLVFAPLPAAVVTLPLGEGPAAEVLSALGWLFAAATLWLLSAPASYRRLAHAVLGFFESSVDEAVVRIVALVAVAIGVSMIYVGICVV